MSNLTATSIASPNIAFIKYWGDSDDALRLPANGSISMNLDGLFTRTTVTFSASLPADSLYLNEKPIFGPGLLRISAMLELVRGLAGIKEKAEVVSENNFPSGVGIASSASAFAALALASSQAAGMELGETELSRLARRGSGSAARSIPTGFVEWKVGTGDSDSVAVSIAPPRHWDLVDCIAIVSTTHKQTSSSEGHARAGTSPLQNARIADAPRRLDICRAAILQHDFHVLANIIELDSDLMHAVMMTSNPPIMYWHSTTVSLFHAIRQWRTSGIDVAYTVDAGANVHAICPRTQANAVEMRLKKMPGVSNVLVAGVGGPARIV
jgi:diphosphomevalonate decarboxylase